ncbi:MAG: glycosyltransferase family 4 protein [Bacteroidales bacterium]|nr:glycosyltransferase family 4 protein [Bacteroidales bacterium]
MKLLFDLFATQPGQTGKRHGGGKYGEIIFKRMIERGYKPSCYYSDSVWLNPEILSLVKSNSIPMYDIDKTSLSEIVRKEKIDKIYSCLPLSRELNFNLCKVVGTIHGLRSLELPFDSFFWKYKNNLKFEYVIRWYLKQIFHYSKWWKKIGNNPNFEFITVSNHSAMSFKSYFADYKDKNIKVFYSPSTSSKDAIKERQHNEKYFLMVSGSRWEKNNLRGIMALDKLFSYGYLCDYKVVVTGCSDAKIFRYKIQNPEKFSFVGYLDDVELEQLYHDAFAFLYPSLNEGFGYPPLEAMHYGIPVLASPFTAIPEICQGSVLYFNPFSVEEIMNRILMITDDNLYKKMSSLSLEQYKIIKARQDEDLDKLIDYLYN